MTKMIYSDPFQLPEASYRFAAHTEAFDIHGQAVVYVERLVEDVWVAVGKSESIRVYNTHLDILKKNS
jgi:hypothetical protein